MTQPSQERLHALLDYDRETGVFRWRETRGGVRAGAVAGRVDTNGYVEIGLDGRLIKAHRLAWIHACGRIGEGLVIDHKNGIKTDNRLDNLRPVTPSDNGRNRHKPAGRNPVAGVSWEKARQKWRADAKVGNKCVTVGRYDSVSEACAARAAFLARIWPELVGMDGAPAVEAATAN